MAANRLATKSVTIPKAKNALLPRICASRKRRPIMILLKLFFGFRRRIKILVGAGLYLAHHFAESFPRIFGVVFVSSRGVDAGDIRRPVVTEHLIGIAVARGKRANLRTLQRRDLAAVDESQPTIFR